MNIHGEPQLIAGGYELIYPVFFGLSMMTQTIHLSHLPPSLSLHINAFTSVGNAAFLRSQLLSSNQVYNYAFVDATTILSRRHLLSACFRALNDYIHDRLKSNNVQSEIVYCLSSNNNIGDAFRRFGIHDGTREIVVVKVVDDEDGNETLTAREIEEFLKGAVEGEMLDFRDEWFRQVCDLDKVAKNYKIAKPQQQGKVGKVVNGNSAGLDERTNVETQVLGLMALRGAN